MTTYTTYSKNSTSYSTTQKSDLSAIEGSPIGLLLALTQAANSYTVYTAPSKNTTSYTTYNKN